MTRFTGKSVIVTGSSNGIGRATAVLFARYGAQVTITGRDGERLEVTKKKILKAGGSPKNVNVVVANLTDSSGQEKIIQSTLEKFGKIDVLVLVDTCLNLFTLLRTNSSLDRIITGDDKWIMYDNSERGAEWVDKDAQQGEAPKHENHEKKVMISVNNAGANIVDGTMNTDQSIELYQKTFHLNFQAVVEIVQKAKSFLIESKGEIVNVSSIAAGPQAIAETPYYAASKAALDQYTRCIAIDLIQYGVRVNGINPGVVSTGFLSAMGLPEQQQQKAETFLASRKECIPSGQLGQPEDIAELIVFLSDRKRSSYIIGQCIVIDGGTSLVSGMHSHDLREMLGF